MEPSLSPTYCCMATPKQPNIVSKCKCMNKWFEALQWTESMEAFDIFARFDGMEKLIQHHQQLHRGP